MRTERVVEVAGTLRFWANHFDYSDWEYKRDLKDLEHIRFKSDYTGYNVWWRRLSRAFKHSLLFDLKNWEKDLLDAHGWKVWKHRVNFKNICISFGVWARKDNNLPDGSLNRGNVIVFWEETGDYLNMVSPAVGSLLADWMTAEPENEYAQKIAALMDKPVSYAKVKSDE